MSPHSSEEMESFYQIELAPEMRRQQSVRQDISFGLLQWLIGGLISGVVLFLVGRYLLNAKLSPIGTVFFTSLIAVGYHVYKEKVIQKFMTLNNEFKEKVIKKIIHFIDPTFEYNHRCEFPHQVFMECGIFNKRPDLARAEDLVSGIYQSTSFSCVEVNAQEKHEYRDSKGNKRTKYVPIFKGLLFQAEFNKNFQSRTVVLTDRHEGVFGFLSRGAQRIMSGKDLVELENPEFEKNFKVISSNQIEARYILSSTMMQKILDLKQKYGQNIQLSFYDSKVVMAIPFKTNLFEMTSGVFSSAKATGEDPMRKQFFNYMDDFYMILGLIEDLGLNQKLWQQEKAG